ncbi:MAG: 30S ribosomal protein S14 [Candidatus Aenigmarchaeota archaeon]|nr:30S ribosomal protein S14 [Candidatus Aenigmarchaeota archaeon]
MKHIKKARKFGRESRPCRRCGKKRGVITSYGLMYCRQCFREVAKDLGFKKYR